MKALAIVFLVLLDLLCPFYAMSSNSIEDESTPIEQEDLKTIDQLNGDNAIEGESTPIEREDDQIDDDNSIEDESTPIEREDMKSIDQINQ